MDMKNDGEGGGGDATGDELFLQVSNNYEINSSNYNHNNDDYYPNGGGGGGGGGGGSDKKRKHREESHTSSSSRSNDDRSNKRGNYDRNGRDSHRDRERSGGVTDDTEVYLKVLVPSSVAGGIIGRGGEKIAQIQKDANVKMKMAKASDVFPGTNERACLIIGSVRSVLKAHEYIVDKMQQEKPGSSEVNEERSCQIKLLIPNNTAGLLIGKGGSYIKQIKDESGAYVQISSKQTDLPERTVIIEGSTSKREHALEIVVRKMAEDPQHSSVTNLNYSSMSGGGGGSSSSSNNANNPSSSSSHNPHYGDPSPSNLAGGANNLLSVLNNNINTAAISLAGLNNLALLILNCGGSAQMTADSLKNALRNNGFGTSATLEIMDAMTVLINYGLISQAPALRNTIGGLGGGPGASNGVPGLSLGGLQGSNGNLSSVLQLLSGSLGKH